MLIIKKATTHEWLKFKAPKVLPTLLYILFMCSIGGIIALFVTGSPWPICIPPCIFTYLCSTILTIFSTQYNALRNVINQEECRNYVQTMRANGPQLTISVECFHYTRVSHGSGRSRSTSTQKVTTFLRFINIPVPYWCDATPPLFLPSETMIHLRTKPVTYWMHRSSATIENIKAKLYNENRHRDTHCSVQANTTVPGLVQESIVLNGEKSKVPFVFRGIRYLFAFLTFGIHIVYHVARAAPVEKFAVIKKASLEAPVLEETFCAENNIDYRSIIAQAPIITPTTYETYNYQMSETEGGAVTAPCYTNQYPITMNDPTAYNQYYQNAVAINQLAAQYVPEQQFAPETALPENGQNMNAANSYYTGAAPGENGFNG